MQGRTIALHAHGLEAPVKQSPIRRRSPSIRERLGWRRPHLTSLRADGGVDRGMAARTLAFLFGLGAMLLLATLLLPDTPQRLSLIHI